MTFDATRIKEVKSVWSGCRYWREAHVSAGCLVIRSLGTEAAVLAQAEHVEVCVVICHIHRI